MYQNAILLERQIQAREDNIAKLKARKKNYKTMLEASQQFTSNQESSYFLIDSINRSVPGGVWFTSINFENNLVLTIKGEAANDQLIVDFISRLQAISYLENVSLVNMNINLQPTLKKSSNLKIFEIRSVIKNNFNAQNSKLNESENQINSLKGTQ